MERDGVPTPGSMVQVKWDENTVYSCTFLGANITHQYTVSKREYKIVNWSTKTRTSFSNLKWYPLCNSWK